MADSESIAPSALGSISTDVKVHLVKTQIAPRIEIHQNDSPSINRLEAELKAVKIRLDKLEAEAGLQSGENKPTSFVDLLKKMNLGDFAEQFQENGWTDPLDWQDITESDLAQMGLKKGHIRRFQNRMRNGLDIQVSVPDVPKRDEMASLFQEVEYLRACVSNLQSDFNSNVDALSDILSQNGGGSVEISSRNGEGFETGGRSEGKWVYLNPGTGLPSYWYNMETQQTSQECPAEAVTLEVLTQEVRSFKTAMRTCFQCGTINSRQTGWSPTIQFEHEFPTTPVVTFGAEYQNHYGPTVTLQSNSLTTKGFRLYISQSNSPGSAAQGVIHWFAYVPPENGIPALNS